MINVGLYGGGVMTVYDDGRVDVSAVTPLILAHGLSSVNRFGGMTLRPYSVGEHSVRLFDWAQACGEPDHVLAAMLIHDGPECLGVGDVQRFVKRRYASDLRQFDDTLTIALWSRLKPSCAFDVLWQDVADIVHKYDVAYGSYEARCFGFPHEAGSLPTDETFQARPNNPTYWSPGTACYNWLERWGTLS